MPDWDAARNSALESLPSAPSPRAKPVPAGPKMNQRIKLHLTEHGPDKRTTRNTARLVTGA